MVCQQLVLTAFRYPNLYVNVYIIYIQTKNFVWEDQRQKQSNSVHIASQGVNSAILFVYRTGYTYGKEPEGFQKVFLRPFSAG